MLTSLLNFPSKLDSKTLRKSGLVNNFIITLGLNSRSTQKLKILLKIENPINGTKLMEKGNSNQKKLEQ